MKVRALLFLCICFSLYVFGQKIYQELILANLEQK